MSALDKFNDLMWILWIWQGKFFYEKAREADEESNKKIFETRLVPLSLKHVRLYAIFSFNNVEKGDGL